VVQLLGARQMSGTIEQDPLVATQVDGTHGLVVQDLGV
jgi:hypothetical protein